MEPGDVTPLLEQLTGSIDALETALTPLLERELTLMTAKLPLLDRAKLQTLIAYALESIIFSTLKLNDVDARNHAVFTELSRVKQYFEKLESVESGGQRTHTVDVPAVQRFLRHDLNTSVSEPQSERSGDSKPDTKVRKGNGRGSALPSSKRPRPSE